MMERKELVRLVTFGVTISCVSVAGNLTFLNNWGLPFVPRALIAAGLSLIALASVIVAMRLPPS
jgi:hypothetical protein